MLESLLIGLAHVFDPANFLFLFIGVFSGIVFGALPGLTATMGLALLVPFTFTMSPTAGLIMLAGIYVGAMYGDAIPAILINTPGTPAAIATTFDGFPLAQKRHGPARACGRGLRFVLRQPVRQHRPGHGGAPTGGGLAHVRPARIFLAGRIRPDHHLNAFHGLRAQRLPRRSCGPAAFHRGHGAHRRRRAADLRLHADAGRHRTQLWPLSVFFCLPEILSSVIGQRQTTYASEKGAPQPFRDRRDHPRSAQETRAHDPFVADRHRLSASRRARGGNIASMVSYNEACRWDKNPSEYGKGTIKGVAASEAANSAMAPGSLIPLLTLGIPGSPPAAVILGGLDAAWHAPRSGNCFTSYADVIYAFIMALLVAAFLVTIIGSFGSFFFARIINIPSRFLAPTIIFMTVLGSYAIRNNIIDVWIMFIFGIIGYISNKLKFHPAPIVLGLILGPFVEEGLVQSMLAGKAAGGVVPYMVFRPISLVLIALSLMSLFWPVFASWKARRAKSACEVSGPKPDEQAPTEE